MALQSLTATIEANGGVEQGSVTVRFDRYDADRCQYEYIIRDHEGREIAGGNDLRSGSGEEPDHATMLGSLLGFLQGAAESYPDGDNASLFPPAACEWAQGISDDLALACLELEED